MPVFKKVKARPPAAKTEHPGRRSFVAYIRHVRPNLTITKQIRLLAKKVEDKLVHKNGWLRLILIWPPRTGKTTAGSVLLLSWVFGLHPDWEAIVGSLSGKLATKIGAKVRGIINSRKFTDVFPDVYLSEHTKSKTEFAVKQRDAIAEGYFFASGRNTRATGQGANCIFFDDLIGEKEADSAAAIEDAHEAIQMWRSRGAPGGFHWIVCNTRYREDDPVGHLLNEYASDGPWDLVRLPAIVEEGEEQEFELDDGTTWKRGVGDVLFPYTAATLGVLKNGLLKRAPHEWYGQYIGLPVPPTGRKIDPSWFKRTAEHPKDIRKRCDRVVVIVDTAKKDQQKNDPSVLLVVGQHAGRHYLLDCVVDRLLLPDLMVRLAQVCLEWMPNLVLVELSANGEGLIDTLRRQRFAVDMSSGVAAKVPFNTPLEGIPVTGADGSKELRFNAVVPGAVRQGDVWLPESAPWVEAFIAELSNFPRVPHDDRSDTLAMWLKWAAENGVTVGRAEVPAAVAQAAQIRGRGGTGGGQNWLTRF